MAFLKYAHYSGSQILDIRGANNKQRTASLDRYSDFDNYRTSDHYLYVRIRAISSRTNRNFDGWPAIDLAGGKEVLSRHQSSQGSSFVVGANSADSYGFSTFLGKPIFVDHNNSDPKRSRGVIVDAKLHVEDFHKVSAHDPYYSTAPEYYLPPTWVELLLEVDAKSFPKFANAILDGAKDPKNGIDGFSMGANVKYTTCSLPWCGKKAYAEDDFCEHVKFGKGAEYTGYNPKTGKRETWTCWENCGEPGFFEISGVFDPADETALLREVIASLHLEEKTGWNHLMGAVMGETPQCPRCGSRMDPDHGMRCIGCGYQEPMQALNAPMPAANAPLQGNPQPFAQSQIGAPSQYMSKSAKRTNSPNSWNELMRRPDSELFPDAR